MADVLLTPSAVEGQSKTDASFLALTDFIGNTWVERQFNDQGVPIGTRRAQIEGQFAHRDTNGGAYFWKDCKITYWPENSNVPRVVEPQQPNCVSVGLPVGRNDLAQLTTDGVVRTLTVIREGNLVARIPLTSQAPELRLIAANDSSTATAYLFASNAQARSLQVFALNGSTLSSLYQVNSGSLLQKAFSDGSALVWEAAAGMFLIRANGQRDAFNRSCDIQYMDRHGVAWGTTTSFDGMSRFFCAVTPSTEFRYSGQISGAPAFLGELNGDALYRIEDNRYARVRLAANNRLVFATDFGGAIFSFDANYIYRRMSTRDLRSEFKISRAPMLELPLFFDGFEN